MFIVRFHGGLGNQIFEYCFYRYLQEFVTKDLKADLTWFDRNFREHQGYELNRVFGIELAEASYEEVAAIHEYYPKYYPLAALRYLARKNAERKNRNRNTKDAHIFDFGPTQYIFNPIYRELDQKKDWYIEGVFCSDAYFMLNEEKLRKELSFCSSSDERDTSLKNDIEHCQSVAVHVRRGDYVGNNFDIVSINYYKRAAEYIKSRVADPVFYVFSDDIDYVEREFGFLENYIPVHHEGKKSYLDMQLISSCRHAIIANSSFSYWGALLGEKEGGIVTAPVKYMADVDVALARSGWKLL